MRGFPCTRFAMAQEMQDARLHRWETPMQQTHGPLCPVPSRLSPALRYVKHITLPGLLAPALAVAQTAPAGPALVEASKINAKHFGIPLRPEVPSPPGAQTISEIKVIRPTVAEVE